MATDSRLKIVKSLIEDGKLDSFRDIFLYIPKTFIAEALGINYTRFLTLVNNPKRLRYDEAIAIARILTVAPRQISELIHNQIEGKRKK